MADEYLISAANLSRIENNLSAIRGGLESVDARVNLVDNNIKTVYTELGQLADEFHEFVMAQSRANRRNQAENRVIQINQEIEKKYGHYDVVRKTTTGILQADDIGIVRKETISFATEELMIKTPGYWLAPCLVALASWIGNQPKVAEKAVIEAIKRDDEKTSLFFALVSRRAGRKQACLKWVQRYLANQDERELSRETIIILDAYASGLLGTDSEGVVSAQMGEWLEHLASEPGFVDTQTKRWSDAMYIKREKIASNKYTYLRKYSKTWGLLNDVMESAMLNKIVYDYFVNIYEQKSFSNDLKENLDAILNNLVSEFDEEEIPLRKEKRFEELVIEFNGDERKAAQNMTVEETTFEPNKDFTQLLTDAAMKPELSNASVSIQKFAIALSKDWITNAYTDLTAAYRGRNPQTIEINIDSFSDSTKDGRNESEMIKRYNDVIDKEKKEILAQYALTAFEKYSLYAGIGVAILGVIMLFVNMALLGLIAIIVGIGLIINHFSKKKAVEDDRNRTEIQYEERRKSGIQIIRATLAEVVDFREEYEEKNNESKLVEDFLEQLNASQYVSKLGDSTRRILVSEEV